MSHSTRSAEIPNDVYTYRRVRAAIGWLGVLLPVLLVVGTLLPLFQTKLQYSISHFYYTNLREVFTGTLCAVGLFLFLYKGHSNKVFWRNDSLLTNIAGGLAFGVAFIPTNPDDCAQKVNTLLPYCAPWLGYLHLTFAGLLFIIFAILALKVFTLGQHRDPGVPHSRIDENNIYRICGYTILVSIGLVVVCWQLEIPYATLVLEAIALFAFGTAWLIKGRALGDKGRKGEMIYGERNAAPATTGSVTIREKSAGAVSR